MYQAEEGLLEANQKILSLQKGTEESAKNLEVCLVVCLP